MTIFHRFSVSNPILRKSPNGLRKTIGIGLLGLTVFFAQCLFSACAAQEPGQAVHQAVNATSQFDLHPELAVGLFAAEPLMANPSNIDIDHLGRVWVCEVINYRQFRNDDAKPREEGDRILILEDTDGDAKADKTTVFYQGRDIDSAHGICVLGDRAIVSANDSVFYLIDTDGDSKADKKELLFTGISGTQHDHGIHAFVFGPDGKLYFNFGNEGKQICDAGGKPIVDMAGKEVKADGKPYNQGMIFRCNLDGSEFETLAWNFRNNWEMCIDSFGTIWQSDNDDDGNRATRINYVMPFGNYGYTEQGSGNNWKTSRTGMDDQILTRHWHQNDPGVIPNLLQTGAGSPTGIIVYEGDALPAVFQGEMIHCDPGPSVVRSYPVTKSGAGYTARIVNMLDGAEKNQWFRPSDVCVAPDGSLIVADWYDPGVGGHRMQDIERGRLFHVTKRGSQGKYRSEPVGFSTAESAAAALRSPNQATRYLAWKALENFGVAAKTAAESLWNDENPRMRARGLWMLVHLGLPKEEMLGYLHAGLADANPDIRVTAFRACVHVRDQITVEDIRVHVKIDDPAAEVRREILIGLRQWDLDINHKAQIWAALAAQYPPFDRWYLESLGIAADGHWNECLNAFLGDDEAAMNEQLKSDVVRDIVWRSRGKNSPNLIAKIIASDSTQSADTTRFFRALDFFDDALKKNVLANLAFSENSFDAEKSNYIVMESVSRLKKDDLAPEQIQKLASMIESSRGSDLFVGMVDRFSSEQHYGDLLKIASSDADRQQAADAMGVLMEKKQLGQVNSAIMKADEATRIIICDSLVNCGKRPADFVLGGIAKRKDADSQLRTYAIERLGETRSGAADMIWWIDQKQQLDPAIMPAIQAALHRAKWSDVKKQANVLFPIAASKDNRPLPSISDLVNKEGDAGNGKKIFEGVGTCAKCHIVNGKGIEVGPDQSEIGSKLTRPAMYESILFPSAGISHNYENWMVMKADGTIITGIMLGETESEIQLKDEKGIKHVISIDDVDEKKKQGLSMMPADLHKAMTEQELVDLIEYLMTLKKSK